MTSVQKKAGRERLEQQLRDDSISASQISPELVTGYKGLYNRYVKRGLDFILALVCLSSHPRSCLCYLA